MLRKKNFNIMGVHRQIQFLEGLTKNQYIGGGLPKGGWRAWTACRNGGILVMGGDGCVGILGLGGNFEIVRKYLFTNYGSRKD